METNETLDNIDFQQEKNAEAKEEFMTPEERERKSTEEIF
nr:MAG TPA: hypothetical protein [Caudoviricetes sp.]